MPLTRFRAPAHTGDEVPTTAERVRALIERLLRPRHFFLAPRLTLEREHLPAQEVAWEVFRGHLVDPAHTRERRTFESWNVYLAENGTGTPEPVLSVKLDRAAGEVHLVRALLVHGWEAYDAGDNVILSREATRWQRELVGTVALARFPRLADLEAELAGRLFQAVVGTSRLPLTSVEAPLPAFSLGELAYFYRRAPDEPDEAMRSHQDVIGVGLTSELSPLETVKLLEAVIRTTPGHEIPATAILFGDRWRRVGRSRGELLALLRRLFNEVSLTPYTSFVNDALGFVRCLTYGGHITEEDEVDVLGYVLRQVGRHLTAYDLITFHHRGANYPDALLLDSALGLYQARIERNPSFFQDGGSPGDRGRLRRRALRQACLLRRFYEGHPVPDVPVSPGENARVLPPPHVRLPEEQIQQPIRRTRRLYDGHPLNGGLLTDEARRALQQCLDDLAHPDELRELGTAVFIDRPLGVGKVPGEPDQTLLFSYEAFSRSIAARRLGELERLARELGLAFRRHEAEAALATFSPVGLPLDAVLCPGRPSTSLADARRVADDFVLLRTLPGVVADFLALFDFTPLAARFGLDFLNSSERLLIVPVDRPGVLAVFDGQVRRRLELQVDLTEGYETWGGVEAPAAGLRPLRAWTGSAGTLAEHRWDESHDRVRRAAGP